MYTVCIQCIVRRVGHRKFTLEHYVKLEYFILLQEWQPLVSENYVFSHRLLFNYCINQTHFVGKGNDAKVWTDEELHKECRKNSSTNTSMA